MRVWQEIRPKLGERQYEVLRELRRKPNQSNTELAASINLPINVITPRVGELREKHLVYEIEKRKCKITGRMVSAWAPVEITGQQRLI